MKKEMLINVLQPEESRIAIVEDGVLEELYVERTSLESYTGNIYKGRVVNLEPAIQAAFVDFSVGRNGFLHVSDVEPQYYRRHLGDDHDLVARDHDRVRQPKREHDDPRASRGPSAEDRLSRDRGHDRPDRSEKGRRDRSEPRPFGEGLVDDQWRVPSPPPRPELERRARPEPPEVQAEPPASPRPARDQGREPRTQEPPAEPRSRTPRPAEPTSYYNYEDDLPPSRTARRDPEADLPPSRTARSQPPPAEFDAGSEIPSPSTRSIEPEPEARGAEPRRGRGRGRGRSRSELEPLPETRFEPLELADEFDTDIGLTADDPTETPRRRGGRAAIRSRGGEREPERPRSPAVERPSVPERPRGPAPAGRSFDEGLDHPRTVEPERPRTAEPERTRTSRPRAPERGRTIEPEPARERTQPHARAGEPGYIPRRERTREIEPDPSTTFDWGETEVPHDDIDHLLDFEEETEALDEESVAGKTEGPRPRPRRRRRGRRRDRADRDESATAEDVETDDDETEVTPQVGRRREADLVHDYDYDNGIEDDEDDEDDNNGLHHDDAAVAVVDEEIDPDLIEEIRREAEEIADLEREMGLRGPIEARTRRGDEPSRAPRGRGTVKPPIQDVFQRGDEVLVQVIKESIGTKGPTLSTYVSIPGRYLVLMPGLNRVGVSRKIADEGQRRKLRAIMNDLNPPKGLGFIVRTAGLDRSKADLARDLAFLLRLWKVILRRIKKAKAPAPIYQESDMITRTIRDIFNSEIDTIWIDEPQAFERAQEFLRAVMPKFVNRLRFYDEKIPLFHKYGLEEEILKIQRRRVDLPGGGSIVIDQTEALVAIDVNSGNFRVEDDAERTAYEMNLRAAKEIARQLRLRDLGGVICNDFIDMRDERNRRSVERALREAIQRDRARTKVLRMSQFGIIEMTRQRIRPSLKRSVYEDCGHCRGAGVVKSVESMAIDVMRLLALAAHRADIRRVNVSVCPAVEAHLNNRKRSEIARLESEAGMLIHLRSDEDAPAEHLHIECFDAQNGEVRLLPIPPPPPRRGR